MSIMERIIEFFSFESYSAQMVTIGTTLLSICSALVGCFTFLKKKALISDTVSHSVLPGICLSFLLIHGLQATDFEWAMGISPRNPIILMMGAVLTGWLSIVSVDYITRKSHLKPDTAIALTLSVFFGLGILLLTTIQHSGNGSQSGLDKLLFGQAAAISASDAISVGIACFIMLALTILFYQPFRLIAFDPNFAQSIGVKTGRYETLQSLMVVATIALGMQAVGVVLMAAMLVTPAAAARYWTDDLRKMLILASLFGVVAGITGPLISYITPGMPTGPWMVLSLSAIAIISILFAPHKGVIARYKLQVENKNKILEDNLLKSFYKLGEQAQDFFRNTSLQDIMANRHYTRKQLRKGTRILKRKKMILPVNHEWVLTNQGLEAGQRLVRIHRLWELYLTRYLRIAPDHVHDGAETIEHIITPEIEQKLEELLGHPTTDPHQQNIPRKTPGK